MAYHGRITAAGSGFEMGTGSTREKGFDHRDLTPSAVRIIPPVKLGQTQSNLVKPKFLK